MASDCFCQMKDWKDCVRVKGWKLLFHHWVGWFNGEWVNDVIRTAQMSVGYGRFSERSLRSGTRAKAMRRVFVPLTMTLLVKEAASDTRGFG